MKKHFHILLFAIIFIILMALSSCFAESKNLSAPESFTVLKDYDVVTINYLGDDVDQINNYEAKIQNGKIAKIGYTASDKKNKVINVALMPLKPGTTKLAITNKKNKKDSITIEIIVPDPTDADLTKKNNSPFDASKLSPYFENGKSETESYDIYGSGSKFTLFSMINLEPPYGNPKFLILYYEKGSTLREVYGYHFTIDGHKYNFTSTNGNDYVSLDFSGEKKLVMYINHEKLAEVFSKIANAKEVKIGFDSTYIGYTAEISFPLSSTDLSYLKQLSWALINSNYLSNASGDSSPTIVFSEEDVKE